MQRKRDRQGEKGLRLHGGRERSAKPLVRVPEREGHFLSIFESGEGQRGLKIPGRRRVIESLLVMHWNR